MKLKRKIFLIFSLVAVIPMIFLTTYTVVQYTHMIDNRMEDISLSSRKIYQMLRGFVYFHPSGFHAVDLCK